MKYEVFTEVEVYIADCWAVAPCNLVDHLFGESISICLVQTLTPKMGGGVRFPTKHWRKRTRLYDVITPGNDNMICDDLFAFQLSFRI